ncbi:klaroid protein-like [Lycorma delicatula]|uniref:klaroid protein-like n=1 Tax=Lycorma delicatula TaxID=130591 RepID=UPI003F513A1E
MLKTSKSLKFGCDKEIVINRNPLQSGIRNRPTYLGDESSDSESNQILAYRKKYDTIKQKDQIAQHGHNKQLFTKRCFPAVLTVLLCTLIAGSTFCVFGYEGVSCYFNFQFAEQNHVLRSDLITHNEDISNKMIATRVVEICSKYRFKNEILHHIENILIKYNCNKNILFQDIKEMLSVSDYVYEQEIVKSLQVILKCNDQKCIEEIFSQLEEKVKSGFTVIKKKLELLHTFCDPLHDNKQLVDLGYYLYGPAADYALEMAGGSIIDTPDTTTYEPTAVTVTLFGIPAWKHMVSHPRLIIQGSILQPGQCWAFHGNEGKVLIKLASPIKVSSVTVEHFPADLLPGDNAIQSAPRYFTVTGLTDCSDCSEKGEMAMDLGCFEYSKSDSARQTFYVHQEVLMRMKPVQKVLFHFKSNHGNPYYTCVYRIKVHSERKIL